MELNIESIAHPTLRQEDIQNIIITSISDICTKAGLNAANFMIRRNKLYWSSSCGIIGNIQFNISYSIINENLEEGLKMVSTMIAFTDLITKEENHNFTKNIMKAHLEFRSPAYFSLMPTKDTMITYIPINSSNYFGLRSYYTIEINYTFNPDTGRYDWKIPDIIEIPTQVELNNDEMTGTEPNLNNINIPPSFERGITAGYRAVSISGDTETLSPIGLGRSYSEGVPITITTKQILRSLSCESESTNERVEEPKST